MYIKLLKPLLVYFIFLVAIPFVTLQGNEGTLSDEKLTQYHAIIQRYENDLKTDPQNLTLTVAIAEAYYFIQDYPQAIKYYSAASALAPENHKIKTGLALSYLVVNDLERSSQLLNELIKEDPQSVDVLSGLGRIEAIKHNPQGAEQFYQRALEVDPQDVTTLYYLGELKIEQKAFGEAQVILEKLLLNDPSAAWIEQALSRAIQGPIIEEIIKLVEKGDYKTAVIQYKQLLVKNPNNIELYIELGRVYTLMGNYSEAIKLYKQGLKLAPGGTRLPLALAYTYLGKKEYRPAEHLFEGILVKEPDNTEALAGLGRLAALSGDMSKAEMFYQKALQNNSRNILTLSYLADLRIQQKKFKEAQQLFEKILQIDPKAIWVKAPLQELKFAPLMEAINNEVKNGNYKQAELLYEKLVMLAPDNVDNYVRFAQFYLKQKLYNKAIEVYAEGLEANQDSLPLLVKLGFAYLYNMQLDHAHKVFKIALERNPHEVEAIAGLGRVNSLIGNGEGASEFYQWALSINPKDITALSSWADLLVQQRNFPEAQQLFKKILEIDPSASWAKQSMVMAQYAPTLAEIKALEKAGDLKGAIARYHQLLTAEPSNADFYYELGRLYLKQKRYQDAIAVYQEGLQRDPSAHQLRSALGLAYLAVNDLTQAKRVLQMAFVGDPKNAATIAGMGRVAALTGNTADAEHLYQVALELNPNDQLALSYFAQFWMEQKQFEKAQRLYERLQKIDPKAAWVKMALEDAKHAPMLLEISGKEKSKEFKEVENLYRQLIGEAPENADYYVKLGQFYVRMKRYQEAVALYLQGLQVQPESMELQVALGFAYLEKGDVSIAQSVFDGVVKKESDNAEALAGLGRLAEMRGDFMDAQRYYDYALKVQPTNLTALTYLAELMIAQKRYEEAQDLYKQIMRLEPSAEWVRLSMEDAKYGSIFAQLKIKEEAKDLLGAEMLWQQLLTQAPNIPEYYLRAGLFYHRIKQYEKAIDTYNKGIKIAPDMPDLYASLGLVHLSEKQPDKARKAFLKALKLDPQNVDALAGMGYYFLMKEKFQRSERYILTALTIDPENIAALSSLGDLRMKEKRYSEAQVAYEKLLVLRPKEKWIKTSLQNAMYGTRLDQIKVLVANEQLAEAAAGYRELVKKAPDNPYYYFGLGLMYVRLKQFGAAIDTYLEGLKENPEENELLVSLGYAYMFNKDLGNAREALTTALEKDEKNPEALAGLGHIYFMEENYMDAECLFRRAIEIDPKNQSALSFFGELLMKQKRYGEAQEVFAWLGHLTNNSEWVGKAAQNAENGPISDLAQMYADREQFELAAELYAQLLCDAPDDPARYLALGQMYVNMQCYCRGIRLFMQGLMFDPDASYLWRAIAFAQIQMADYASARCILAYLIAIDDEDAESWAGLGRIEALHGSQCCAEVYLNYALDLSPNNVSALSFLAALRQDQQYNFSGLAIYETLMTINSEPKWVRVGYNNFLNLTQPTITFEGAYHEEDEWNKVLDKWSARYQVYGGGILINYPISDELTLWGRVADQIYQLKDLLTDSNIYSFDVQRVYIGGRWIYSPCFYIDVRAGLSSFSPYRHGSFCMLHGTIAEPALTFTYHQPTEKATLSFTSDADLIARDFSTNRAKLVGRYIITGTYEREVIKRGWIGVEADAYWYRDFVNNTSQRALAWFQWRPPCYSDNILFRYFAKYQSFAKNIPDYYTYQPQIVNQVQVTLEKSWRVCWADSFYTSLSYGHGWQDTHTRFPQIIVIVPATGQPKKVWDRRQFNILFGNVIYNRGRLQLSLGGDYYRDTEKYTIWSVAGSVRWRF